MTTVVIKDLAVRRGAATLLDGVSLSAKAGEFIGVVGPNGAGKSTLLRTIAGIEHAAAGSVVIDGVEIRTMRARERARMLAYLPQAREVHWAATADAVASLGRFAYGAPHRLAAEDRAAVERALAATDALSFRQRIMPSLSGGEQARVHLARVLAAETPVILADEPTAALDLKHALSIAAILRARADAGRLVVAALHDLSLARRFCTRLVVLDGGTVALDGAPEAVMEPGLVARVFHVAIRNNEAASFDPLDRP